jgi:hypothetical protein
LKTLTGQPFLTFGLPVGYQTATPNINRKLQVSIYTDSPGFKFNFHGKGGDYVTPKLFGVGNSLIVKPYDLDHGGMYYEYHEINGWSDINVNQIIRLIVDIEKFKLKPPRWP